MFSTSPGDKPDPFVSPTFLLSVLFAARKSGDAVLERLVARRLAELGIRVQFAANMRPPAERKAVNRG